MLIVFFDRPAAVALQPVLKNWFPSSTLNGFASQ
jgi:hypothetical protein